MRAWLAVALAVAGCGKAAPEKKAETKTESGSGTGTGTGTGTGSAKIVLEAAKALPVVPVGLPPVNLPDWVTPEQVALGEKLFFDKRIGKSGACAGCHDPDRGWGSSQVRDVTAGGKPNLRHTPALVNLAWVPEVGWDGRFPGVADAVAAHWKGQLGVEPDDGVAAIASDAVYQAHFARLGVTPNGDAAVTALAAFVLTRYQGDSPWDRYERGERAGTPTDAELGYLVFNGRGQCAVCHVPPLYSDGSFHRLGLIGEAGTTGDDGRGVIDPAQRGGFRTPTLRGAALHPPYFHDGSAATLEDALAWHLAGGVGHGAGRDAIDEALVPIQISLAERELLIAFMKSLSPDTALPYPRPQ